MNRYTRLVAGAMSRLQIGCPGLYLSARLANDPPLTVTMTKEQTVELRRSRARCAMTLAL